MGIYGKLELYCLRASQAGTGKSEETADVEGSVGQTEIHDTDTGMRDEQ